MLLIHSFNTFIHYNFSDEYILLSQSSLNQNQMIQSQHHQNASQNKAKKGYSRKQLTQWISKQMLEQSKTGLASSFNVPSLKNGVFFLFILQKMFPNDSSLIKSKIKEKPVTQYDFEKNLSLVKKVLNNYKLQMNLDVNEIIKSRNCFDFLNWLKNLIDGSIPVNNQESCKDESQKTISLQKKYNMNSDFKSNRESSQSKNDQKALSQSKSNRNHSSSKSQNPFNKLKSGKNIVLINKKQPPVPNNNRCNVVNENKNKKQTYMSQFDSLDDCNEALYQIALGDSIQSFKSMLGKVKSKAQDVQNCQSFQAYLNQINSAIFGRP